MRTGFDGAKLKEVSCLGYWIEDKEHGINFERYELAPPFPTIQDVELWALHRLLNRVQKLYPSKLKIQGDEKTAIGWVNGRAPSKHSASEWLVKKVQRQLREIPEVRLIWVPREKNTRADRLVRLAKKQFEDMQGRIGEIEEALKCKLNKSISYDKKEAFEEVLQLLNKEITMEEFYAD